jgi:hypothetical protein
MRPCITTVESDPNRTYTGGDAGTAARTQCVRYTGRAVEVAEVAHLR